MKRFITVVEVFVFMLAFISADASPQKGNQTPATELPPATKAGTSAPSSLSGKVVETMNAGGYTYLCLEKSGKKTWVAVPEMQVTVGQNITLQPGAEMTRFTSKSLNRTFDAIIFSTGPVSRPGELDSKKANEKGDNRAAAVKSAEKITIEKPAGAGVYTVAEIFVQRAKLNKKKATLKAKVVKVSAGIMGKNWIHLQDGTGDAAKGTNNLVVTSQDLPAVGDIVTMKGTIYKDKDFGAGYKYNVIMEQGSIQR